MDSWAERKWKAANESGDKAPNADVKTEPGVTDVQQKITPWIQDIELEKKSCEGERTVQIPLSVRCLRKSTNFHFHKDW